MIPTANPIAILPVKGIPRFDIIIVADRRDDVVVVSVPPPAVVVVLLESFFRFYNNKRATFFPFLYINTIIRQIIEYIVYWLRMGQDKN